jgi:hypothetical protein
MLTSGNSLAGSIRWRDAPGEPGKFRSGQHTGIRCNEQGVEEAGIPVCGLDDLLRVHAGNRAGQ